MSLRLPGLLVLLSLTAFPCRWPAEASALSRPRSGETPAPASRVETTISRRVNVPFFDGALRFSETAVFWFGSVTPTQNSVDVRVGYNDEYLFVHMAAFDRRLWYDTSPSPADLTAWDAVTLYLDLDGNEDLVPDSNTYRFEAQLVWWEARDDYQAVYRGDDGNWVTATVPFTTTSDWRGDVPNDGQDDRGWAASYYVPFRSLGLSQPPSQGSVWGLALAQHDRDDTAGTPLADQIWPETMEPGQPATWGQLAFGTTSFSLPAAVPGGIITIRHGLDGAVVVDADVGGSSVCGETAAPDYFSTWGNLSYAGKTFLNIQNQYDVADWPCFSRYYVTFPLEALPTASTVLSATLTLHQFGNAGESWIPGPQPSLIQVLTVGEDWDEQTVTWNNAPLAVENVSAAWVEPLVPVPDWPGVPRKWDVSRAVAEAYAAGQPLRLALYEADDAYQSGKYFVSSDADQYSQEARPTLTVRWGKPLAAVTKTAAPLFGGQNEPITYSLSFLATGQTLTLTDTLPDGVSAPLNFELAGTSVAPTYDGNRHRLTWSDTPPSGQKVIIRYVVDITTAAPRLLTNNAELYPAGGDSSTAAAIIFANPYSIHLPLILRHG